MQLNMAKQQNPEDVPITPKEHFSFTAKRSSFLFGGS